MSFPSYASTPQIITLPTLLEDLRGGHYSVPRFQRPFLWSDEQRLELLRSVREGIPIGAVLTWRTHTDDLETYPNIGPHRLGNPPQKTLRTYVLDGHQRLSTLYGALIPVEPPPFEDSTVSGLATEFDWDFFFDLDSAEFRLGKRGNEPWWLPLDVVLDGRKLRQFQRELERSQLDGITDEVERSRRQDQIDRWNEQADRLVHAFTTYSIPVMPFLTEDLEVAVRTFERINTQGTSMSEVHIVAALTWSKDFDFRERLQEVTEGLADLGWGGLDEKLILQTCKVALGLNAMKAASSLVRKRLTGEPQVIEQAEDTLHMAASFLAERCSILGPSTLPYSYQAVLLAEAFRLASDRTPALDERLERWLWATTLGEHFAGMSSAKWSRTLQHLHQLVEGKTESLPPELGSSVGPTRRFDFRSARTRALVIWMASEHAPHRADGTPESEPHRLLAEQGKLAAPKLLTARELGRGQQEDGPENRILVHPKHARALRRGLIDDPRGLPQGVTESHFIDDEALDALQGRSWTDFLARRRETLCRLERRRAQQVGLTFQDDL